MVPGLGVAVVRTVSDRREARSFDGACGCAPPHIRGNPSSCRAATRLALALTLLVTIAMDKYQDADLEKGYEDIEEAYFDENGGSLFDSEEDLFESHGYEENEYEYEPEGAFLD